MSSESRETEFNEEAVRAYFKLLGHTKQTEVRVIDPKTKESKSYHVSSEDEFVEVCRKYNGLRNIYAGVHERIEGGTKKKDVVSVKHFIIDIDCANKPASEEDLKLAFETAQQIKKDYSIFSIIPSGNGHQLYKRIPKITITDDNRRDVENKIMLFGKELIEKYSNEKVKLDNVYDLPRVMRVPGTINLKSKTLSKIIEIDDTEDAEFSKKIFDRVVFEVKQGKATPQQIKAVADYLTVDMFVDLSSFKQLTNRDGEYQGSHPYHPTDSTTHFNINTIKKSYECWKHNHGGYLTELYAIGKGIISCGKPLEGENLHKAVLMAIEEFKIEVEEQVTEEEEADEIENLKLENLKYPTIHIHNYALLNNIINLLGDNYIILKKNIFYYLVSSAIQSASLILKLGNVNTDMRVHNLFVLKSGRGKLEIKEGTKKILLSFNENLNVKEMAKSHYQQLIGKVLCRKNPETKSKEYIKKMGFVFSDVLIFEECHELLSSIDKNDIDCRDVLTIALDPYLQNLISKQNIDNLDTPEETIEGYPQTRMMGFVQPLPIPEKIVTKGLARRMKKIYVRMNTRTSKDKFAEKLKGKSISFEEIKKYAEYLKQINKLNQGWQLEDASLMDTILNYHQALVEQGYRGDTKAANFTEILEWTLLNDLIKYAALNAASNLRTSIKEIDIKCAYVDLAEILAHELDYIVHLVAGNLDYGESWSGAIEKEAEILDFLYFKRAFDFESGIRLSELQDRIKEIYNFNTIRATRRTLNKITNFISKKRDGIEWKVWLKTKKKKKVKQFTEDVNPLEIYNRTIEEIEAYYGSMK